MRVRRCFHTDPDAIADAAANTPYACHTPHAPRPDSCAGRQVAVRLALTASRRRSLVVYSRRLTRERRTERPMAREGPGSTQQACRDGRDLAADGRTSPPALR